MSNPLSFKFDSKKNETEDELKEKIALAMRQCGKAGEGFAKLKTPVDTGRLRNSITSATSTDLGNGTYSDNEGHTYGDGKAKGTPSENEAYFGTNVTYAPFVERGARGRAGAYMLEKALYDHQKDYENIIKQCLTK